MTARSLFSCVIAVVVAAAFMPDRAVAQTARVRYETALARDTAVRQTLSDPATSSAAAVTEARAVIAAYEAVVRRYPISGYSDNALYNAAVLADAIYERLSQPSDRSLALRLYRRVGAEYPASPLIKSATTAIARLDSGTVETAAPAPAQAAPAPPAAAPAASSAAAAVTPTTAEAPTPGAARARLTTIDRDIHADGVRITLGLDREVSYHEETLAGPARVFFDLRGVEAAPSLVDAVLRFPTDVVRQIRVGRHPNSTVRVVLDLDGVKRHSVYTLYNPFRLVIECEPHGSTTVAAAAASGARVPAPAAPPALAGGAVASRAANTPIAPPVAVSRPNVTPPAPPAPAAAPIAATAPPLLPPIPAATAPPVPARTTTTAPLPSPPPVASAPSTTAPSAPSTNGVGGFSLSRQLGLGVSRIVIDAGHGGHDPGAQSRGMNEADLTLDIALRLEKLFLAEPGIEVVLTRRTNEYIPLEERTAIANREGADLFLSIHANTSRSTSASGVETYFLSFASTPDAEAVAARENSAHGGEMHKLPDMIKAIALNNKLDESRDLAGMVQESLIARLRRSNKAVVNRGVKKAPFVVLIGAEMPSVLAEVSFLTNRQEQQLLKTPGYKDRIAEALHAAVMRYRLSLKGAAAVARQ